MKSISIIFEHSSGPTSGGASFLHSLYSMFNQKGLTPHVIADSSAFIFNSHHSFSTVVKFRRKFNKAVFIHRIDGPMSIYNKANDPRDSVVSKLAHLVADGIVFQSDWSKKESLRLGLTPSLPSVVIHNAPDPKLFHPIARRLSEGEKIRIVGTSWSSNPNKGFSTWEWLDQNLDFSRYEVNLYGQIPGIYKNIRIHAPVEKKALSEVFKSSHIYLMPSRFEACSNALLEAIHSGLPCVTYAGSSNTELVTDERLLFQRDEEIPSKLDFISRNYQTFMTPLKLPTLSEIAEQYINFAASVKRVDRTSGWALWKESIMMRFKRF